MSSISQSKSNKLGHPTSSPFIYSYNLRCRSGVPTNRFTPPIIPLNHEKIVSKAEHVKKSQAVQKINC